MKKCLISYKNPDWILHQKLTDQYLQNLLLENYTPLDKIIVYLNSFILAAHSMSAPKHQKKFSRRVGKARPEKERIQLKKFAKPTLEIKLQLKSLNEEIINKELYAQRSK